MYYRITIFQLDRVLSRIGSTFTNRRFCRVSVLWFPTVCRASGTLNSRNEALLIKCGRCGLYITCTLNSFTLSSIISAFTPATGHVLAHIGRRLVCIPRPESETPTTARCSRSGKTSSSRSRMTSSDCTGTEHRWAVDTPVCDDQSREHSPDSHVTRQRILQCGAYRVPACDIFHIMVVLV
jgi:hypothetical protein